MLEIKDLLKKSKETMNKDSYQDFALNTIKSCGYNSDTFDLLNKANGKINTKKYSDKLVSNLKEYAKLSGFEDKQIEKIKLEENKDALSKSLEGIIEEDDLNSILFDINVEVVDDLMSYDKISGIDFFENIDTYLEEFKTGVDLIDHSDDYCHIKEDIYADAGLSTIGLENVEKDTNITIEDLDDIEDSLDDDLEMIK